VSAVIDGDAFQLAVTGDAQGGQLRIVLQGRLHSVTSLARRHLSADQAQALCNARTVADLLPEWDRHFDALRVLSERARSEGEEGEAFNDSTQYLAPTGQPSRMLYAAANYSDHVAGMRKTFTSALPEPGQPTTPLRPYLFVKACAVTGAFDDIQLPAGMKRIDWEAEAAVVIGVRGKNISAARAMDHVAGFMTTNDVSCRDRTWREDRPSIRSDWFSGKSFDTFAPIGPYFLPRAFVRDHRNLSIRLWVNGVIKQDGNTRDMTFGIEEQIEYAAQMLTLQPGDLFATGTPAGTGQERLEFLKNADVVETEVEGCGRQRNNVVAAVE
jgi:2-keto-4-pentenoate hydratase/2-oxohepta-3-ene-1,7-dioic acid hydratase in catechol pathway